MASPLMDQYARIKAQHAGEILLFHLGDFYEMFYEDAQTASRVLGIALTSRQKGEGRIPMCGVPIHNAPNYINRLLQAGHRVAICEQLEEADETKGLVDRGVTRVITPGTLVEEGLLEEKRNNFLAAVHFNGSHAGLAWIDLSTGLFRAEDVPLADLDDELTRLAPSETLIPAALLETEDERLRPIRPHSGLLTPFHDWTFDTENARRDLCEHFGTKNLAGYGCDDLHAALGSAGALLAYLKETQKIAPRHLTRMERYVRSSRLFLDRQTQSSLELTGTLREGKREGTLLGILDRTMTPMGARMMRDWVTAPLRERDTIELRLDAVSELRSSATEIQEKLRGFGDLERVLAKIGAGRAHPRDLASLRESLRRLPSLRTLQPASALLREIHSTLGDHSDLLAEIDRALVEEPPLLQTEGGIFRPGFHPDLDRLRDQASGGKDWLVELEEREIRRTGIPSLKVGFNRVFGYYIEITNVHQQKVPADYVRKQTLKNAERYITPELKEHESTVLHAEERSKRLEQDLFVRLRERVAADIAPLQKTALAVAQLDTLASLGLIAREYDYVRPEIDDSENLEIEAGRHPVVERIAAERFVPNDTRFGGKTRLLLITGPNMAGKSTYIRQTALLTLMAQMGSFVPAKRMRLGVVDRIFTRVGAADELTRGASTFMVEMNETANILHHASAKSLVILDEIGRGTSTFDGVSIAWAVAEHLHDRITARTLFATHYHELTELSAVLPGVKNLHVAVREWGETIIFLHQIVEGATDKSYGIHVARIAGIPREVVERSKIILSGLEALTLDPGDRPRMAKKPSPGEMMQLSLFAPKSAPPKEDPLRREFDALDPDRLTPIEALQKLAEWKKKLAGPAKK